MCMMLGVHNSCLCLSEEIKHSCRSDQEDHLGLKAQDYCFARHDSVREFLTSEVTEV